MSDAFDFLIDHHLGDIEESEELRQLKKQSKKLHEISGLDSKINSIDKALEDQKIDSKTEKQLLLRQADLYFRQADLSDELAEMTRDNNNLSNLFVCSAERRRAHAVKCESKSALIPDQSESFINDPESEGGRED